MKWDHLLAADSNTGAQQREFERRGAVADAALGSYDTRLRHQHARAGRVVPRAAWSRTLKAGRGRAEGAVASDKCARRTLEPPATRDPLRFLDGSRATRSSPPGAVLDQALRARIVAAENTTQSHDKAMQTRSAFDRARSRVLTMPTLAPCRRKSPSSQPLPASSWSRAGARSPLGRAAGSAARRTR